MPSPGPGVNTFLLLLRKKILLPLYTVKENSVLVNPLSLSQFLYTIGVL